MNTCFTCATPGFHSRHEKKKRKEIHSELRGTGFLPSPACVLGHIRGVSFRSECLSSARNTQTKTPSLPHQFPEPDDSPERKHLSRVAENRCGWEKPPPLASLCLPQVQYRAGVSKSRAGHQPQQAAPALAGGSGLRERPLDCKGNSGYVSSPDIPFYGNAPKHLEFGHVFACVTFK